MSFGKILAKLCDKKQPKPAAVLIPMSSVSTQPQKPAVTPGLMRVRTQSVLSDGFSELLENSSATPVDSYRSVDSTPVTSPDLMTSPSSATPSSPDLSGLDVDAVRKELFEVRASLASLSTNHDEMSLFGIVYLTERPAKMRALFLTGLADVVEKYIPGQADAISALRAGAKRLEGHHQFDGSSLRAVLSAMQTIYPVMQEKAKSLVELIKINTQFQPIRESAPQSPRVRSR